MLISRLRALILVMLLLTLPLRAVTRVAYTRPGNMMKIPTTFVKRSPYLFTAGFSSEIHRFSPFNTARGVYFSMDVTDKFTLGFSSGQGADTTSVDNILNSTYLPPVEFGFHFQQKIYVRNDISFSLGLHDVVFENASDGLSLDPKQLSFFGVIGSEKSFGDTTSVLTWDLGLGGFLRWSILRVRRR